MPKPASIRKRRVGLCPDALVLIDEATSTTTIVQYDEVKRILEAVAQHVRPRETSVLNRAAKVVGCFHL